MRLTTQAAAQAAYLCWMVLYNLVTRPVTTMLVVLALAQIESIFYYLYNLFMFIRWFNLQTYYESAVGEATSFSEFLYLLYYNNFENYYCETHHYQLLWFHGFYRRYLMWGEPTDNIVPYYTAYRFVIVGVPLVAFFVALRWEIRLIKNYWTFKYGSLYLDSPVDTNAEKMFPHSRMVTATAPQFQAEVFRDFGDGMVFYSGVCFRVGDRIYTAGHVVEGSGTVYIQYKDRRVPLAASEWNHLEMDVAYVSASSCNKLLMPSAKVAQVVPLPQSVKIVARGQSTHGILRDHEVMGMVTYDGSTIAGFSGAPYCVGNVVLGIHTGHIKTENVGVSFSYINLIVRRSFKQIPESTEDFFDYEMQRAGKQGFAYKRDAYHPDEYLVRVAGRYHMIQADVFHKISSKYEANENNDMDWVETESKKKKPKKTPVANPEIGGEQKSNFKPVDLRTSAAKIAPGSVKEVINQIDESSFLGLGPYSKAPPVAPRNLVQAAQKMETQPLPRSSLTYESAIAALLKDGAPPSPQELPKPAPRWSMNPRSRVELRSPLQMKSLDMDPPESTIAQLSGHYDTMQENLKKQKTASRKRKPNQLAKAKRKVKTLRQELEMVSQRMANIHDLLKSLNIPSHISTSHASQGGCAISQHGGAT